MVSRRVMLKALISLGIVSVAGALYSNRIETNLFTVTRLNLGVGLNYRIIHISDTHFGSSVYDVDPLINIVKESKPDIIIHTGDLITTLEGYDMAIDFIIHTPGGLALAATQIANALKEHKGEVRVIVPHYAMSGGTLIALAADKIIMDPHAVLGPVDPQIGQFPAISIKRVLEVKPVEKIDDQTLILADVAEKALQQMYKYLYNLLRDKGYDEETAKKVAEDFSQGKWTHDYPLTYEVLKEYNLRVSTDVPEEVYELMELYPQPKQNAVPAVQYIPVPYKKEMRTKEN